MSQSLNFLSFRPAQYHTGKCCFVSFYVLDPLTGNLTRRRVKVDHVPKNERRRYAMALVNSINEKLYSGWNPLAERLKKTTVTIGQAIDYYLAAKAKETRKDTMRSYRSFATSFGDWLKKGGLDGRFLISIGEDVLLDYLLEIEDGLSARTYNNYITFLRGLFEWCKHRRWIAENPAQNLKTKRVDEKKRVIIPADIRAQILRYFEAENPNFVCVMMLCYRLFIRPKEICGLKVKDVDFADGLLTIPADVAKNHKERVLAMPEEIRVFMDSLSDAPKDWYLFSNTSYEAGQRKKPMAPTRIDGTWEAMREALNLPSAYQFYSLKDTGITEMLEAGVPAKFVKELADHHSLAMTERYTHKAEAKKVLEWNRIRF